MAVFIALLALVGVHTSLWVPRLFLFGMGIFLGQTFVPIQAASFATISPAATGRASTMFNAVRQLGGAVGVAAFTTVVVAVGAVHVVGHRAVADLTSYHAAFPHGRRLRCARRTAEPADPRRRGHLHHAGPAPRNRRPRSPTARPRPRG